MSVLKRPKVFPSGSIKPMIQHRQHIDYKFSAEAISNGSDLFFTGIRRQTAHAAAKRLSMMIGEEVLAFPHTEKADRGYVMIRKSELEMKKQQVEAERFNR